MLKISLSIIACILFSLTLNHFLPWQIDNEIITKIIIVLSIITGLSSRLCTIDLLRKLTSAHGTNSFLS